MTLSRLILAALLLQPTSSHAEGILGKLLQQSRRQTAISSERQDKLDQIKMYIDRIPDAACKFPESDLTRIISARVEASDLMDTIGDTVFYSVESAPSPGSSQAIMAKLAEERRQQEYQDRLRNFAMQTGGQVPVGQKVTLPPEPKYKVALVDIKATDRVEGGLKCSANIWAGSLRFPIIYTVVFNPSDPDGWSGGLNAPELTEAFALANPDRIRIRYHHDGFNERDLSLAEARVAGAADHAKDLEYERKVAARRAYFDTPAGRAEIAERERKAKLAERRRAEACVANGGTWGYPVNSYGGTAGRLGCYFQTVGK